MSNKDALSTDPNRPRPPTTTMDADAWSRLGTATVSDALDRLGIAGQCEGLGSIDPSMTLAGPVYTVRYAPCGVIRGTVGDYIDDVDTGMVVALDNSGRTDATVWGDILTEVAHARGVAGTVIDGVCRDTAFARSIEYPIYSRGNWMRTGKDRVQVDEIGGPISLGGVRVCAGDWVVADADGIVALPVTSLSELFEVASEIWRAEEHIRELVRRGKRLDEARAEVGYHQLQSRR